MYKVCYATGSRADYGIVRRYLQYMNENDEIDFSVLVTGTHLEDEYGYTKNIIQDDGFRIDLEVYLDLTRNRDVSIAIAKTVEEFGKYFAQNKPDMLIILGDRYEMLGVAIAAALNKIKILHIHGGEATFGNYDEFIRHAITKMSLYHFVATETYKKRVIQLGEYPDKVFNLGALGAENCKTIDLNAVEDAIKVLETKKYFVVLFHPETLNEKSYIDQVHILLSAIEKFPEKQFVFLGSNADSGSYEIREANKNFVDSHQNCIYIENLSPDGYHYAVKNAICLVGNSSSGLIEAPSLGAYTINIGDRQKGREYGNSVINVPMEECSIIEALEVIIGKEKFDDLNNPYETEDTAKKYFLKTIEILKDMDDEVAKVFYDLEFSHI